MMIAQGRVFWTAIALACLATGGVLSHCIERDVQVASVTLAGGTPVLKFLPAHAKAPPVVLLAHGVTASKEALFRLGEALAAAGFACYAVDLPGHGQSPKPFYFSQAHNMQTLEDVARAIGPVDIFAGHSMGGGAGMAAVRDGGLHPRLFIAIGCLPPLAEDLPPLFLLEGEYDEAILQHTRASGRWSIPLSPSQFEEVFPTAQLGARTDVRLALVSWCDHLLEPFHPGVVNAAVDAACAAVGKSPPAAPTRWLWRLAGMVIGWLGALGLMLQLPALPRRLMWLRGPLVSGIGVVTAILTMSTWIGAMPAPRRILFQIAIMTLLWVMVIGANRLRIPRWAYSTPTAAAAIGCMVAGAYFLLLVTLIVMAMLVAGTILAWIATRRGTQRDGNLAMAVFVGYAIGLWLPLPF